ncbi:peptide ABC transporter permease [Actinomadura sp. NBRC 104425]|uniref:ABC transporter permease n=1 Tax=Actinomadura sp. NBRC 104425 TaxID=3032204 RepID=UPI0024A3A9D9|nr:ABC transporter permease [Actinomadura sp. NBRC 104425]GLZ15990.1 peptide ABC transporter permease [Actinomadura sp. NBRC 104425]
MTAPIEVSGADTAQPDAVLEGVGRKAIQGRSLGQIAWLRLRRDKVAMTGGVVIILLVLVAVFAPLLVKLFGHPPNEYHQELIDPTLGAPMKPLGGMSGDFLLGLEPTTGRDLFSRIVYGSRVSLLVGFLATVVAAVIGTALGVIAGYFGGWIDAVIARLMDVFLAFPLLLFSIAIVGVMPDSMLGLSGNGLRIAMLVFIIGFFSWPYIGRIVRGQTLSLREREFVDAARSMGARAPYIIVREILPNLVAPILVYATLMIPTNILFEAALSFLGVGIEPPTPSWGGMLTTAVSTYQIAPYYVVIPGVAIFVTVMAFNVFGDGLRDALDPRTR